MFIWKVTGEKEMGIFIAAWFWPVITIVTMMKDGTPMEEMASSLFETGFMGCLIVMIYMTVSIFSDGDSWEELFYPDSGWGHLARIGCVVDVICLFAGVHISYHGVIQSWVKDNGLQLNLSYILIILFVVFLNWKANRVRKKEKIGTDTSEEAFLPFIEDEKSFVAFLLFVPTLVLYVFNGMPDGGRYNMLAPIPLAEWQWANKLSLAALILTLVKYVIIQGFLKKQYANIWKNFALFANIGVVAFLVVLMQRGLHIVLDGGFSLAIFLIVSTGIETLFQLYSYLFILYCVIDFFAPGTIREIRIAAEIREMENFRKNGMKKMAREEYEKELDEKERKLNERLGLGPYTNEEIHMRRTGESIAEYNEYAMNSFLREQKLEKYDKKNL